MIDVMTNGRGALAARVGELLVLPSGREVSAEEPGWVEDLEHGEEDLRPECLSAARAAEEKLLRVEAAERSRAAEERRAARGRDLAGERASTRRSVIADYRRDNWRGRSASSRDFDAEASALLDRIEELPERAEEFAEGVRETVRGMRDTFRRSGTATEKMWTALDNIDAGVSAWEH